MKAKAKEKQGEVVDVQFVEGTPTTSGQSTALVPVSGSEPNQLIRLAVEKDLDVEKLKQLMELQERYQREQARIAFFDALARFQSIVPEVSKGKNVSFRTDRGTTSYNYAPLGEIDKTIKDSMRDCGLSKRWEFNTADGQIECTCVVSHALGHSERTTMAGGFDTSGGKNSIQSRGSTMTYLQRYTLIGALGLSTADEDNDGQDDDAPQRPAPRQSEPRQEKAAEKPSGPDRGELVASLNAVKKALDKAEYSETHSRVDEYAERAGFGPVKKIGDVPTEHLKGLTDYLKQILLTATAPDRRPTGPGGANEPLPDEEMDQAKAKAAGEDEPLSIKKNLAVPWRTIPVQAKTLIDLGVYRHNEDILNRISTILNTNILDIADIPDKATVGKVLNAFAAEIVEAKKGKR